MENLVNEWNKLSRSEKVFTVAGIGLVSVGAYLFSISFMKSIGEKKMLGLIDGASKATLDAESAVRRGILSLDSSNKFISMAKIKHGIKFKKF